MTTDKVPEIPLKEFKRTKIIATLGPATNSYEQIENLISAGANGIRLNFSHGEHSERTQQIAWIRKASKACGKPVAVIQDLQGPKIRLGDFKGEIKVSKGETLTFGYKADYERLGVIPIQYDLSQKVKRGERLFLCDGKIRTHVTSVRESLIYARVENEGVLTKRKGINLPDTDFGGDIITAKDKTDLAYGSSHDVDYVALSFIQTAQDIQKLRRMLKNLGSTAKIIAKIETKHAADNLEEIVKEADVLMIARGDLSTETLPESVPIIQRKTIELGMKYAKPTIVATQMLASMTEAPEPTRAEVSDIGTAVLLGADNVMLSDETAVGNYPIEAVKVMKKIINYIQSHALHNPGILDPQTKHTRTKAISAAVIDLAKTVHAVAIVAETKRGLTALELAARRPKIPIIAVTSTARVAQQLALAYGTKSYVRSEERYQATKLTNWLHDNKVLAKGDVIVTASGHDPGVAGATDTIKVRVL